MERKRAFLSKIALNDSTNLNLLIVFFIYGYGNKRCDFEELVGGSFFLQV